jgi:hypothetical protein
MSVIKVFTDDGQEVAHLAVDDKWSDTAVARRVAGHLNTIHGWLGRALDDARIIQAGGDPERASEKTMRLMQERRQRVHIDPDDKPVA